MNKAKSVDKQYGRLSVLERVYKLNTKNAYWLCRCDCGKTLIVSGGALRSGNTSSCGGHYEHRKVHGHTVDGHLTHTYTSWYAAKTRVTNPNQKQFADYGGRGIKMCERWRTSFSAFLEDMGEVPVGMSLDRINGNGHYEPGNCRWADRKTQSRNSRRARLTEKTAAEIKELALTTSQKLLASQFNVSINTVNRVIRGVTWA